MSMCIDYVSLLEMMSSYCRRMQKNIQSLVNLLTLNRAKDGEGELGEDSKVHSRMIGINWSDQIMEVTNIYFFCRADIIS